MSKYLLGDDYMLWIKAGALADFVAIDGQGTLTDTRSQTKIPTASKNRRGYNTGAFGNIEISLDIDITVVMPDPGYLALETAVKAVPRQPFMVQVRKNGLDGVDADSIFTSSMNGSISSRVFNQDGAVNAKASFSLADIPTLDQLS